jgi:hypothetical protein
MRFFIPLLAQLIRHRALSKIVNVRRDGTKLGWVEHIAPAGHAGIRNAIANHGDYLVGAVAVFPFVVGEVTDRRAEQVTRDRTIAPAIDPVAIGAAPEIDLPSLAQQGVLGHFRRRWRYRLLEQLISYEPARDESEHPQKDQPRCGWVDGIGDGRIGCGLIVGQGTCSQNPKML